MKNIRIIARFLLILMLSVYLLPFSTLTVAAEKLSESMTGTYTWTAYREKGYDNADDFRKDILDDTDEWDDFIDETEENSPQFGQGDYTAYVVWYALSCMKLKVDWSGNLSGKQSGKLSFEDKNPEEEYGVSDYEYSIEVTAKISDNDQSPDFNISGTLNRIYHSKNTDKTDLSFDVTKAMYGTISTDFSYKTDTRKYYNPVHLDMENGEIGFSGSIYYILEYEYTYTVNEGEYFWGLKKGDRKGLRRRYRRRIKRGYPDCFLCFSSIKNTFSICDKISLCS